MKKFFKNRFVAILLCVLIVVGSTLLNTRIRLNPPCRRLTESFYAEDSIAPNLKTIRDQAIIIASAADDAGADSTALRDAAAELMACLDRQNGASVGQIYAAYEQLNTELLEIKPKVVINQSATRAFVQIADAQKKIQNSSYIENVNTFLSRYDRFPARQLAELAGVHFPEAFG